ncbi:MAG: AI-2E family transporter, partial [Solirubrobacteraceae bacterium]
MPSRDTAQVLGLVRWLLIAIFVVLGYVVLSYLAGVLAPILTALGVAYLLNPLLERLVRRGASRPVGAALLLVSFVGTITVAITMFAPTVAQQASEFVSSLPRFVANLGEWAHAHLGIKIPSDWESYVQSDHLRENVGGALGPLRELAGAAVGGVFSVLG